MLNGRTARRSLLGEEGAELLPALRRQFFQADQHNGLGLWVGGKGMLACSTNCVVTLSQGLMRTPEVRPAHPRRSSPGRFVASTEETMDF